MQCNATKGQHMLNRKTIGIYVTTVPTKVLAVWNTRHAKKCRNLRIRNEVEWWNVVHNNFKLNRKLIEFVLKTSYAVLINDMSSETLSNIPICK